MSKNKEEKIDISQRKSISVKGKEFGISGQLFNWILKRQGRLKGKPGHYHAVEEYKKYEHQIQDKLGFSYDPEFFDGIIVTEQVIQKAREELQEFRKSGVDPYEVKPFKETKKTKSATSFREDGLFDLIKKLF